jgi:RNA polymerase-binding transcription factor DksA
MKSNLVSRLKSRRQDIVRTIAHIRQEQVEVERNTEWKDLGAQQRRYAFLADLSTWYDAKLKQVDQLLDRITQPDRFAWRKPEPDTVRAQDYYGKEAFGPKSAPRKRV